MAMLQGLRQPSQVLSHHPWVELSAIFLTTMVSVGWSQGEAVSTGAIGPLIMVSLSVPAFRSAFTFYVPSLGIPLGAVLSHLTPILCVTIPVVVTLRWCNRREERLRAN